MGRLISYLKAKKMISKGYLDILVRVKYSSSENLTLVSVPGVIEFPKDLSKVTPKKGN